MLTTEATCARGVTAGWFLFRVWTAKASYVLMMVGALNGCVGLGGERSPMNVTNGCCTASTPCTTWTASAINPTMFHLDQCCPRDAFFCPDNATCCASMFEACVDAIPNPLTGRRFACRPNFLMPYVPPVGVVVGIITDGGTSG